ncbi:hypothetical protein RRG08_012243 [Elysia crispata]|uniref:Uncharacterized protein n=1 Tax=Elysia crispata TaxID=231223 RepID=A0AAE1E3N7_9GAST|nr:hypothetical protein RRG08_012243 [Elysia crispata]
MERLEETYLIMVRGGKRQKGPAIAATRYFKTNEDQQDSASHSPGEPSKFRVTAWSNIFRDDVLASLKAGLSDPGREIELALVFPGNQTSREED